MIAPNQRVRDREPCSESGRPPPSLGARTTLSNEARRTLRVSAVAVDANAAGTADLAALWYELARGGCSIVDEFFSRERCYLVLTPRTERPAHPIEGRRLQILHAVLQGLPQANIAIDLELAPSTVALNSKLGLESLGVPGKPSRAHPLLMMAAMAASEPSTTAASATSFAIADRPLRVIGAARPDHHLSEILPSAEFAVIQRLVEGCTYAEIAAERGTSTRTIANQITAVFRRLHVSGRNELIQRLLLDAGLIRVLPETLRQTPLEAEMKRCDAWQRTLRSA